MNFILDLGITTSFSRQAPQLHYFKASVSWRYLDLSLFGVQSKHKQSLKIGNRMQPDQDPVDKLAEDNTAVPPASSANVSLPEDNPMESPLPDSQVPPIDNSGPSPVPGLPPEETQPAAGSEVAPGPEPSPPSSESPPRDGPVPATSPEQSSSPQQVPVTKVGKFSKMRFGVLIAIIVVLFILIAVIVH